MGLKDDMIKKVEAKRNATEEAKAEAVRKAQSNKNNATDNNTSFSQPEPVHAEVKPEPKHNSSVTNSNDLVNDLFGTDIDGPIPEPKEMKKESAKSTPEPQKVEEKKEEKTFYRKEEKPKRRAGTSMSNMRNQYGRDTSLQEELLVLAKTTILNDIKENFESRLLSPEAAKELIDSYVLGQDFSYENRNQILIALLQEVRKNKDYSYEHYSNYLDSILDAIITDLQE